MAKRKRGNGEGSVHKVSGKANLWRAVVTVGYINGKRIRKPVYAKSKAAALDELRKLTAAGPKAPTGSGKVNTATVVNRYLARATHLRASTLDSYRTVANTHVLPRVGTVQATAMTPDLVRGVLDEMAEAGSSASKRCHALTVMRQAFDVAVAEGVVSANPTVGVKRPRIEHHEIRAFSGDSLAVFLAAVSGHAQRALFVAAVGTALRQGELLSLRWGDLDLDAGLVAVRRTVVEIRNEFVEDAPKTKAGRRSVTLPAFVVAVLREHKAAKGEAATADSLVFPSRNGKMLRRQNLHKTLKLILAKAGLPASFRFHDQRHTSATLLLAAGEHPKVVQERLGHSKITTTLDIYAHVLPGMQAKAATRLDGILRATKREAGGDDGPTQGDGEADAGASDATRRVADDHQTPGRGVG